MTAVPWIQGGNNAIEKLQQVYNTQTSLTTLYDFDSTNAPVYIGEAIPGTATSAAGWRIQKRGYTSGRLTSIKWATGDGKFNQIWNNRASFNYS